MEQAAIVTIPAPKNLDTTARAKFRELLPILETRGDVDQGALDLLTCYCAAWSAWLSAGDDQDRIRWLRALRQLSGELRLSPKSRTATRPDEKDPILRLLRKPE